MNPNNNKSGESTVDVEEVFSTLAHPFRRCILTALMSKEPRWQDEFETKEFRPSDMDRRVSKIRIHHFHLPYLDDAGFIDWQRKTGMVTRGGHFEDMRSMIIAIEETLDG
jgi:hypothetical protein